MSDSVVCTLFEGNYHFGLGALINSLHANDFRGVVWAGYRGNLPPWAEAANFHDGYHELNIEGCSIRFVELVTDRHLANYKGDFILDIWDRWDPDAEAIFYFDPDIVVKCEWWFFEQWAKCGVALCLDVNWSMPANHPVRLTWLALADGIDKNCKRQLDVYYNSGFIGVHRKYKETVLIFSKLGEVAINQGMSQEGLKSSTKPYDFLFSVDQDILNLAAMLTPDPLSTVGPDGMDFVPGGYLMSHAVGAPKPWKKPFVQHALKGFAPTKADKLYLHYSQSPIQLYSATEYRKCLIHLRIAAAIGRLMRRA